MKSNNDQKNTVNRLSAIRKLRRETLIKKNKRVFNAKKTNVKTKKRATITEKKREEKTKKRDIILND